MYVVYIYMYVCMYVVYIYMCIIHVCIYVCTYTYVHVVHMFPLHHLMYVRGGGKGGGIRGVCRPTKNNTGASLTPQIK